MAVTLSSDLIVDVMRGADPARRHAAVAKLQAAGEPSGNETAFANVVDELGAPPVSDGGPALSLSFSSVRVAAERKEGPYQGFERMVLRNLFETLLPDEGSGAFGAGPSAGVWRSMAADQMAGVYTQSGGVGIARLLEAHRSSQPDKQAQWPYFEISKINAFAA